MLTMFDVNPDILVRPTGHFHVPLRVVESCDPGRATVSCSRSRQIRKTSGPPDLKWKSTNVEVVLTGFIGVVVVGALLFLWWGGLLAGSGLPPLVSPGSGGRLFRRGRGRRVKSSVCRQRTCKYTRPPECAEEDRTTRDVLRSPCWADAGGRELWTSTVFLVTAGLP